MKIIYFGYDLFSPCLLKLLELGHEIVKIYSFEPDGIIDTNHKICEIAKDQNIEFTTKKVTAESLCDTVRNSCADLIFCAGYAYKIPIDAVNIPAVNIHPSPLPRGRGPWPMPWVILNGEKTWAVTAHKLTSKIDEGDILLQKEFALDDSENLRSLNSKIVNAAVTITNCLAKDLQGYWQNSAPQGTGEYLPEPGDEMRTVYSDTPISKRELIERAFTKEYVIYKK